MGKFDADREEWVRYLADGGGGDFTEEHCDLAREFIAEVERLRTPRAVLDEAERLLRNRCVRRVVIEDGTVALQRKVYEDAAFSDTIANAYEHLLADSKTGGTGA